MVLTGSIVAGTNGLSRSVKTLVGQRQRWSLAAWVKASGRELLM